jgi:prepilin-type N-terminal cleavage/methylation domain-containing protein
MTRRTRRDDAARAPRSTATSGKETTAMRSNRGFTLAEIMVAVLIGGLVIGAVIAIQMMSTRTFAEGSADAKLERVGNLALDKIVRGPSGQYGLREARLDTVYVSEGPLGYITFQVDRNDPPTFDTSDDTQSAVYLDYEGTITYDPDTGVYGDEIALNAGAPAAQMNVSKDNNSVSIELVLQETVHPFGSTMEVRVRTSVKPRID